MTLILSKFHQAVTFLCCFLLVEQKKANLGPRGLSEKLD
jgi:hypothetical protein